jgi:hypothetical protein
MDFKPKSAERDTHVDAIPSSPDGYFLINDDPLIQPFAVTSIALRGIKPRHVKALLRSNTSVMKKYVIPDTGIPSYIGFNNCRARIPDPLQPVGTSIAVRKVQEVYLDRTSTIDDAHSAVGKWWAERLLHPMFEADNGKVVHGEFPDGLRSELEQKAGDFALILASLSRNNGLHDIHADYTADRTLRTAAEMAFVPAPISSKSYTMIKENGVVIARQGYGSPVTQIWPPGPALSTPEV